MHTGRVAPASVVAGLVVVGWAKVGAGDEDGRVARLAPLLVIYALDLEAGAADEAVVEQSRARGGRLQPVPFGHRVLVAACALCKGRVSGA